MAFHPFQGSTNRGLATRLVRPKRQRPPQAALEGEALRQGEVPGHPRQPASALRYFHFWNRNIVLWGYSSFVPVFGVMPFLALCGHRNLREQLKHPM